MKDIEGYEGLYAVTEDGRVWSYPKKTQGGHGGKFLKPVKGSHGYLSVSLRKHGIPTVTLLHRIVATAFIPNPYNKKEVNHKNFIRTDCSINNLEWVTPKENVKHTLDAGRQHRTDSKSGKFFNEEEVLHIKRLYDGGQTGYEIAEHYGVTNQTIYNVLNRVNYKYVGA